MQALLERPVLANSASLIALRATNLAARLLRLFVIARLVDPATFGWVIFAVSIAEIAKVVSDFGMDTLAIREYAAERSAESQARFAGSLAAAKLSFGVAVYLALAGWFLATQSAEQSALGLIVGTTALTSLLTNFSLDFFQARLRISSVLLPVLATNVAVTLAAVWALPRIADLRAQVALLPALEAATGIVLLIWLRREPTIEKLRLAFAGVPDLVRKSLPLAVTGIVIMTYSRLDVLVLSSRLDAAAVGYYGIAFRITEPFQLAAAAFGLSVFSRFSSWFQSAGVVSLRKQALRYLLATLGYGAGTAIALGFLAPPVIEWALPDYAPSVPIVRLLSAALVFRTLNATLAGIIQGAGRFRLLSLVAIGNLVVVFALLTGFVSRFQAPGAALALLVAEALNSAVQLGIVARIVSQHDRKAAHEEGRS